MKIYLVFHSYSKRIYNLINLLNLEHDETSSIGLIIRFDSLSLYDRTNLTHNPITVDFTSKENYYRCNYSRKKNENLYKAVGIKQSYFPIVLDLTAGLGKDAFILSFLGCKVIMIERHPIVGALLKDGLERAYQDKKIGNWLKKRLHLILDDSLNVLQKSFLRPDVIYLDPMYPLNKKKSLPKKRMQILRKLIGDDYDIKTLLTISRKIAKKRIIIKRPCYAKSISEEKVNFVISGKKHRFDIYNPY